MADTLLHDWFSLSAKVGEFLGFGDDPTAFDTTQAGQVRKALDGGYRRFLFPPGYSWTFMRAVREICKTAGDVYVYGDLDAEIANVEGDITILAASGEAYGPIRIMNEGMIRARRSAGGTRTGRPLMAALYHRRADKGFPGGLVIEFWPTPDQAYTIQGRCQLNPQPLSAENPIPVGGPQFGQLLLEACLAEAETQYDDMQGVHAAAFQRELQAAIRQDEKLQGEFLGQVTDSGTPEAGQFAAGQGLMGWLSNNISVTFNDTQY